MASMLFDLEDVLRSKPNKDRITLGEEEVISAYKVKAARAFNNGFFSSSVVTWIASRSLSRGKRISLSVGFALVGGYLTSMRSLNPCVGEILDLEGSRMQKEMATVILTRHGGDVSKMQLVRKYYYPEQVFNDADPEKTFYRLRPRGFFADSNVGIESVEGRGHQPEKPDDGQPPQRPARIPGQEMTARRNSCEAAMMVDPLDCLFGDEENIEEIASIGGRGKDGGLLSRRQLRAMKRAHRRYRARQKVEAESASNGE